MSTDTHRSAPQSSTVVHGQFLAEDFVQGGGVAIFHLASERVVICSADDRRGRTYYFLPKGRRDAGEDAVTGAEREGYEESGYRNRVLPLPIKHRQPQPHPRVSSTPLTAEPIWIEMMPLSRSKQYLLYWYIAETMPPDLEKELEAETGAPYKPPPPYPTDLKLRDRVQMEPSRYEPIHHEGTGVDAEEQAYKSYLVSVNKAVDMLSGTVMADVVSRGWRGIQDRYALEDGIDADSPEQMIRSA